jgi:hypothetical protein
MESTSNATSATAKSAVLILRLWKTHAREKGKDKRYAKTKECAVLKHLCSYNIANACSNG